MYCNLIIALMVSLFLTSHSGFNKVHAEGIGQRFHRETSLSLKGVLSSILRWGRQPAPYKTYPEKECIKLPEPTFKGLPLEDAIKLRRSVRDYSNEPMTIEELSQLLHAASGVTAPEERPIPLRAAPSAGALYPIEIYIVVNNVKDLEKGLYHYNVLEHSLEFLKKGDFRGKITNCALHQEMAGEAGVTFVLTGIFRRSTWKYDERGYRYTYIEAGHISQNIYLQSTSLGLGSVAIGAFYDDSLNDFLGIDGKMEAAIYMHAVGKI